MLLLERLESSPSNGMKNRTSMAARHFEFLTILNNKKLTSNLKLMFVKNIPVKT